MMRTLTATHAARDARTRRDRPPPPRLARRLSFSNAIATLLERTFLRLMGRNTSGEIRPNGPGHDIYLKEQFAQDSQNPFSAYDTYTAITIPHTAVVLLPADAVGELPLTLSITEADING